MRILHTSFECYPVAKVGGLADVVGSLPKYQNELNNEASVVMPYYNNKYVNKSQLTDVYKGSIQLAAVSYEFQVKQLKSKDFNFNLFVISIVGLLDRENVYGYEDETNQYIAFQLSLLDWILHNKEKPEIIHCHDHHTSLIPFFMKYCNAYVTLKEIPTVLTIHNAQYQGHFSFDKLNLLPSFNHNDIGVLDWYGSINPMATAIKCASKVTTVSPSYMEELKEKANGLEGLLRSEKDKCIGILNGIDTNVWNTETDPLLAKNYTQSTIVSGKKANKKVLCDTYGLNPELPLFGFIGRLVGEKSADLLPSVFKEVLTNQEINILVLGSGHQEIEIQLEALKNEFEGKYNVYIGYDEKLSHLIYAGADFLIMPSRVEPCGLNQMYSLRYGTIPIVRRTGGLKDTVIDIGDNGFGICHDQASVWDISYSINRAVGLYTNTKLFKKTQKQIMKIDNSWNNSAQEYINLYKSI